MIGVGTSIMVPFSATYANELIPESNRILMTTLINTVDASTMMQQVSYYSLSRNIYPLHGLTLLIASIATFSVLWMPESPKYFYARNRYDEARRSLGKIAKFNGRSWNVELQFDKEVDV